MTVQLITQQLFKIFSMKKSCLILFFLTNLSLLNAQVMPQGFFVNPPGMIGSQLWTTENLAVTVFLNGDAIPNITSSANWGKSAVPQMCSYNFNPANDAIYGKLYNYYAITDTRGVCPVGFHIPSSAEFTTLSTTIGGNGGDLKEVGYTHWYSPNTGATDKYGFKALGTGYMGSSSASGISQSTYFWTNTESGVYNAYTRSLFNTDATFNQSSQGKIGGFAVRCLHD
jgi:uncharacterized protein (TIGR02145 family)